MTLPYLDFNPLDFFASVYAVVVVVVICLFSFSISPTCYSENYGLLQSFTLQPTTKLIRLFVIPVKTRQIGYFHLCFKD